MSARFTGRKENHRLTPAGLSLLGTIEEAKIASERLGHARSGSLDFCSHVLPNMQADAVAQVDDALRAAINTRTKTLNSKWPFSTMASRLELNDDS
jgi:hypothetical protein